MYEQHNRSGPMCLVKRTCAADKHSGLDGGCTLKKIMILGDWYDIEVCLTKA